MRMFCSIKFSAISKSCFHRKTLYHMILRVGLFIKTEISRSLLNLILLRMIL